MSKPYDFRKPPMSLKESEKLLRGADQQQRYADGWKIFGWFCFLVVCILIFLRGVIGILSGIARTIF
jgi:hypothetical protein